MQGAGLTPSHLPALIHKVVQVKLLDACSKESPLSKPSFYNKIDRVVACLPIVVMAPFVSAPAAYPCNSGVCSDRLIEKDT
jgi:hypothetical protein